MKKTFCLLLLLGITISCIEDHTSGEEADSNNKYIPGGGLELFYQAQSLDELIYARGWLQGEDKNLSNNIAWDTYEHALSTDIKTICETFSDERLRRNCPFNHAIILQGEPGTGKSTCGFAIGKVHNCRTILIPATDLADSYKNSSTQYLPRLLQLAMNESKKPDARPIILIIDEFNSLTDRHKNDNNSEPGVVEAFFMAIDRLVGSNVLVILTTNAIEGYPASFYSRYNSYTFTVSNPSPRAREIIIDHLQKKATYELDDAIEESEWQTFLLALTESFNFRKIQDLFFTARLVACKKASCDIGRPDPETVIYQEHFVEAAQRIIANRSSKISKAWSRASKYCKEHQAIILVGLGVTGIVASILTGMIINKWQNSKNEKRHKESLDQGKALNKSNQAHSTNLERKKQWGEVAHKKRAFNYTGSLCKYLGIGELKQRESDAIVSEEIYRILSSTEKAEDLPDLNSLTIHPEVVKKDFIGRNVIHRASRWEKMLSGNKLQPNTDNVSESSHEDEVDFFDAFLMLIIPTIIGALL